MQKWTDGDAPEFKRKEALVELAILTPAIAAVIYAVFFTR